MDCHEVGSTWHRLSPLGATSLMTWRGSRDSLGLTRKVDTREGTVPQFLSYLVQVVCHMVQDQAEQQHQPQQMLRTSPESRRETIGNFCTEKVLVPVNPVGLEKPQRFSDTSGRRAALQMR